MKRGITLRTNGRGRRFVLNFQIGYDSSGNDDENDDPSEPEGPSLYLRRTEIARHTAEN